MWRELRASAARSRGRTFEAGDAHVPTARPSRKPLGRSSSRTSRCRSTTCSRSRAPRASIRRRWCSGLGLSIVLMGFAANLIARLLHRHRWIAYVGLAIILYVALDMIWRGAGRSRSGFKIRTASAPRQLRRRYAAGCEFDLLVAAAASIARTLAQ